MSFLVTPIITACQVLPEFWLLQQGKGQWLSLPHCSHRHHSQGTVKKKKKRKKKRHPQSISWCDHVNKAARCLHLQTMYFIYMASKRSCFSKLVKIQNIKYIASCYFKNSNGWLMLGEILHPYEEMKSFSTWMNGTFLYPSPSSERPS